MVVSKIDSEAAKRVRSPAACRRHKTEAGGIHHRHDCHRHAAIWKVYTADTAIKLNKNAEEVFVGDVLGVHCTLDTRHHELVLWGDRFGHPVLLILLNVIDSVPDR